MDVILVIAGMIGLAILLGYLLDEIMNRVGPK